MTDHNLLIEHIGKRQRTEQFREGFIHPNILVLGFHLALKAVNMIDLLCLVVSSGHMQEIFIGALPGYEGKHAFHRKRASVHEIAVEEVLVSDGWVSVEFEDVVEVVVLAVDVSTNGDLLIVFDRIVNQGLITGQNIFAFFDDLECETLVEGFLFLEAFHQLNHPK